ncbi:MAG TPA: TatD family hydrolase, partial [Advenella sp.]|nr:TatD family hydrolase [Advenella sp.]
MFVDTHCHLDAAEFDDDRNAVIARAEHAAVRRIVIPAIGRSNFSTVRRLAHSFAGGYYALGIHPLFVAGAAEGDLDILAQEVERALADPRFVAIGEIGLDFFVKEMIQGPLRERQEFFYQQQLKLAREYDLPVLLHVRRSQDIILKYLRRYPGVCGIAHAFNGSDQQADHFVSLGFALGFGGAMTFTRAHQIRRLASRLPLSNIVLETDAPDIPPAWLQEDHPRNTPEQIPAIAR